ncbi:MAG: hypothetical protein ACKVVT_07875 [Dehalococcoidia bacterium]
MESAIKILIVTGTLSLTYAFLLGFAMAQARMKAPEAPRHLVTTHMEGLLVGAIHLGLTVAVGFSDLAKGLETVAAVLLGAGAALSLAGGTLNWRAAVGDQFAAKSPGYLLQAVSGPVNVVAILIVLVGVLGAL